MPIKSWDEYASAADAKLTAEQEAKNDYVSNFDPNTIWQNATFLADARDFLSELGYDVSDDEKVKDAFYEVRNARDLNTVSLLRDAGSALSADETRRARDRRLVQVWDQLPAFWQDGGRGLSWKVAGDIGEALVTDPLNIIPVGGPAAAAATKTAIQAGKSTANAIGRGIIASLPREIGFNAAVGAVSDTIVQTRDQALDLQNGYDLGRLLESTALAGAAGAAGAPLNAIDAYAGVKAGRAALADDAARAAANATEIPDAPELPASNADGQFEMDLPGGEQAAKTDPLEALRQSTMQELDALRATERSKIDPDLEADALDRLAEIERAALIPKLVHGFRLSLDEIRAKDVLEEKDLEKVQELQQKINAYEAEYRDVLNLSSIDEADDFIEAQRAKRASGDETQLALFPTETGEPPVRSPNLDPQMFETDGLTGEQVPTGTATPVQEGQVVPIVDSTSIWLDDGQGGRVKNPAIAGTPADPDYVPPVAQDYDGPATFAEAMVELMDMGFDEPDARRMIRETAAGARIDQRMQAVSDLVREYREGSAAEDLLSEIADEIGDGIENREVVQILVNSSPKYKPHADQIMRQYDRASNLLKGLDAAALEEIGGDIPDLPNAGGRDDYTRKVVDALFKDGTLDGLSKEQENRVGQAIARMADVFDGQYKSMSQAERALMSGAAEKFRYLSEAGKIDVLTDYARKLAAQYKEANDTKGNPKARSGSDSGDAAVVQGDKQVSGRSQTTVFSQGVPGTEGAVVGGAKGLGKIQSILKKSKRTFVDEQGDERGIMQAVRTGKDAQKDAGEQLKLAQMDATGVAYGVTQQGNVKTTTKNVTRAMIGYDGNGRFFVKADTPGAEVGQIGNENARKLSTELKRIKAVFEESMADARLNPKWEGKRKQREAQLKAWRERQVDGVHEHFGFESPSARKARLEAQKAADERGRPTGLLGEASKQEASTVTAKGRTQVPGAIGGAEGVERVKQAQAKLDAMNAKDKAEAKANEARISGADRRVWNDDTEAQIAEIMQGAVDKANANAARREADLRRQARKEGWTEDEFRNRLRSYHDTLFAQLSKMVSPEGRVQLVREIENRRLIRAERDIEVRRIEALKKAKIDEITAALGGNNDAARLARQNARDYFDGLIEETKTTVWEADTRARLGLNKPLRKLSDLENAGADIDAQIKAVINSFMNGEIDANAMAVQIAKLKEKGDAIPAGFYDPPESAYEDMLNMVPEGYEGVDPNARYDAPAMGGTPTQSVPEPVIPEGRVLVLWHKTKPDWHRVGKPGQSINAILGRANVNDFIIGHGELKPNAKGNPNARVAKATFQPIEGNVSVAEPPKAVDQRTEETVRHPLTGKDVPVSELWKDIFRMETRDWTADGEAFAIQQGDLAKLYAAMPDYRLPNQRRHQAMDQIAAVFDGADPRVVLAVKDVLRRIGADVAPNIKKAEDGAAGYNPNTNTIYVDPANANRGQMEDLIHEIAHWAYFNVLSPEDKAAFWQSMAKFYPDNRFDPSLLRKRLAVYDDQGNLLRPGSNAASSAQEYFANQFVQHVLSGGKLFGTESMWQKIVRVVRSTISRFFDKGLVDPDLQPLFDKVLPDEVGDRLFGLPAKRAETPRGRQVEAQMSSMSQLGNQLHDAISRYSISNATRGDGERLKADLGKITQGMARLATDLQVPAEVREKVQDAIAAYRAINPIDKDGNPTMGFRYFDPAMKIEGALDEAFAALDMEFVRHEQGMARIAEDPVVYGQKIKEINTEKKDWLTERGAEIRDLMSKAMAEKSSGQLAQAAYLSMQTLFRMGAGWKFLDTTGRHNGTMGGAKMRSAILRQSQNLYEFMGYGNVADKRAGKIGGDAWAKGLADRSGTSAREGQEMTGQIDWSTFADRQMDEDVDIDQLLGLTTVDSGAGLAINWKVAGKSFDDQFAEVEKYVGSALASMRKVYRKLDQINRHADPEWVAQKRENMHWKARRAIAFREANAKRAAEAAINKVVGENAKPAKVKLSDLSKDDLWKNFQDAKAKGQFLTVRTIGAEIARRIKAKPSIAEVEVPRAVMLMKHGQLVDNLTRALIASDKKQIDVMSFELWRRANKEQLKNLGNEGGILHPTDRTVIDALKREIASYDGEWSDDIPPGTAPDVRELMLHMTHRDKAVQADMRTMLGRMVALLGKDVKGDLSNANIVTTADVARLTGLPVSSTAQGAFVDLRGPEFRKLQKDLRRITIGLNKESADPFAVVHEIGHMAYVSKLYSDNDRAMIFDAYRRALGNSDTTAMKVRRDYGDKSQEVQAAEWFSEGFAQYLAERVSRGDALNAADHLRSGAWTPSLKSGLEVMLDRMVEGFAYIVNGLIGRQDMKQMFRRATFYGDMRAPFRSTTPLGGSKTVPASMARDYAQSVMLREDPARKAAIRRYTGDFGYNGGKEIVFYHGTLHGGVTWDKGAIPDDMLYDVVMNPSAVGERGKGIYVTANPDVADWVYAKNATGMGALEGFLDPNRYPHLTPRERQRVRGLMEDLIDVRNEVAVMERMAQGENYYAVMSDGEARSGRAASLDNRMDVEDYDTYTLRDNINAGKAQIAALVDQIRDLTGGVEGEVLPLYVRAQTPLDLTRTFNLGRPQAQEIMQAVMDKGLASEEDILRALFTRGYTTKQDLAEVDGGDFYDAISDAIEPGGLGNNPLNEILRDVGYDSIKDIQTNTLADGSEIDHDIFVLFDPSQVKHQEADLFDPDMHGIFASDFRGETMLGALHNAAIGSGDYTPSATGELAALANAGGVPTKVAAAMSAVSKKIVKPEHVDAVAKVRSVFTLKGSTAYMRDVIGAHWMADKMAPTNGTSIREAHDRDVAAKITPILDSFRQLEGQNGLTRWFKYVASGGNPKQSPAVSAVVKAVRRGDPTDLDAGQRQLFDVLVQAFENESKTLREDGARVGRINNYFPQVHRIDKIRDDMDTYVGALADYFQAEHKRNGVTLSRTDAVAKARQIAENLIDDNGVWTPPKAERRSSDMRADHQRMLRLHEPWALDHLKALELFLEDNLLAIVTRYFDESTRRDLVTKTFGTNVHAAYDYLQVAAKGESAIADLLIHDKIVYDRHYDFLEDGSIKQAQVSIPLIKGFDNREYAVELAQQAIAAAKGATTRQDKIQAVKDILLGAKPNAQEPYKRRVDAIANALADFDGKRLDRGDIGFMEQTFRRMLHKPGTPGTAFYDAAHMTSRAIKDFNNLTLLSYTTLTSLTDVALPLIRSGNLRATTRAWKKFASDPSYRIAMGNVGASINRIVALHSHLADGEPANHWMNAFFEGTGLGKWTAMQADIASAVGFEAFADAQRVVQQRHNRGGSDRRVRMAMRLLKTYGLEGFGLPNAPSLRIDLLSKPEWRKTPEGQTLSSAMIRFSREAIFQPDFADKPLWAQGPFGSIIFQLKSYPLMYMRLAGDVLSEARQGNVAPLAYLLAAGGGLGAGVLGLKDLAQARGGEEGHDAAFRERSLNKVAEAMGFDQILPEGDMDKALGWMLEGFLLAGGLGLIGSSLWDIAQQQDNGYYGITRAASTIFGPSVGVFADGMHVLAGTTNALIHGEDDGTGKERQAVRSIAGRIPLLGGNMSAREGVVDLLAGEKTEPGRKSSGGFGDWAGSWSGKW